MILSELLSELRDNILYDRSDRVAGNADIMWSDATLVRYINEAQNRFARRSLVLVDGRTPEVVTVTLREGVTHYDLHPSIIAVVSAKMDGANNDLTRLGHAYIDGLRSRNQDFLDPANFDALTPGEPVAFSTDDYVNSDDNGSLTLVVMRVFPTPSAADAGKKIKLRVIRKPIEALTTRNMNAVPELPEDHHLEMLDWAAYLALRVVDQDAGSPRRAQEFASSFETHVTVARRQVMRKLFAPVGWGFGKNGWS